jgi:primosomal protein N''
MTDATTQAKNTTQETAERLSDFNERLLDAGRKAANSYLDAYEKTLQSVADYQEKAARQTDVEWISSVVGAQAKFTRDLTQVYVSAARELIN